jgi:hypothetical protein
MKKLILVLNLFLVSCNFGTVGDSLEEKKLLVARLSLLRSSLTGGSILKFVFFDDQSDSRIENFQLSSLGETYTIQITDRSKFELDKMELVITKANNSESEISTKHDETSSTTSVTSSNSNKFLLAQNYSNSSFYKANTIEETGSAHSSIEFPILNLPVGVYNKITLHFKEFLLYGTISTNVKSKNFIIQIANTDINLTRFCNLNINFNSNLNLKLQIKYSNLFRDTSNTAINDSTKIMKSIIDLSDTTAIINSVSNSAIYTEILKNLNSTEVFKEYRCNR